MANRVLRDWTQSEVIDSLSEKAEVFFTRLIMKADDYGCYYGNEKLLKCHLYPLKNVSEKYIKDVINECVKAGLLIYYKVENKHYVKIINFGQRLRQMKSRFPQPNDSKSVIETDSKPLTIDSSKPLETETETETEGLKNKPTLLEFLEYCKTIKEFDFVEYKFSLENKYQSWVDNNWKDGNNNKIKNWKSKIRATYPYLNPIKQKTNSITQNWGMGQ